MAKGTPVHAAVYSGSGRKAFSVKPAPHTSRGRSVPVTVAVPFQSAWHVRVGWWGGSGRRSV